MLRMRERLSKVYVFLYLLHLLHKEITWTAIDSVCRLLRLDQSNFEDFQEFGGETVFRKHFSIDSKRMEIMNKMIKEALSEHIAAK